MSREPYLNGPPYSDSGCGWWWLTGTNDPIAGYQLITAYAYEPMQSLCFSFSAVHFLFVCLFC